MRMRCSSTWDHVVKPWYFAALLRSYMVLFGMAVQNLSNAIKGLLHREEMAHVSKTRQFACGKRKRGRTLFVLPVFLKGPAPKSGPFFVRLCRPRGIRHFDVISISCRYPSRFWCGR